MAKHFFFFFLTRLRQTDCFTSIILSSPQFSLFSIVHRPATLTPSDPLPYPVPFSGYFLQSQSSNLILFRLPLINMFLDPFLTPLGNSRETLASGDTGLGLGLISRVVHSEGLPSSPLRIFASRELRKRKFEIMRWEGGVDLGEIKGSRFFSCSVVFFYLFFFVFAVVIVLPLITLSPRWTLLLALITRPPQSPRFTFCL